MKKRLKVLNGWPRKFWKIFTSNALEFGAYIILGLILPFCLTIILFWLTLVYIPFDLTLPTVLFSVFFGFGLHRFFQEKEKIEKWLDNLKVVKSQIQVWTTGFQTLRKLESTELYWGGQLRWLKFQLNGISGKCEKISGDTLEPHSYERVEVGRVLPGTQYLVSKEAIVLVGSIRSINHKIDQLNLLVQILYFRDSIDEEQMKKIGASLNGAYFSIYETLEAELPLAEKRLTEILESYGYN